jgi:acetate kinase
MDVDTCRLTQAILALNAGSSNLKFGLYDRSADEKELSVQASGVVRDCGEGRSSFTAAGPGKQMLASELWAASPQGAVERLFRWVRGFSKAPLAATGHRVVYGGKEFSDPVEIDDAVLARLEALGPLAPLHQKAGLAPIRVIRQLQPELRQVVCFDTAFHRTIAPPVSRYALPRAYEAEGIRRYGFHGLSYESIAAELAEEAEATGKGPPSRLIVAHLGNGASLCAMRDLKSVDTTMGFSTLDGLVMGTRPGSIDPGIILYLLKEKGDSVDQLEELLYRRSGLLGVSGISADVTDLLASDAPQAFEALDLFAFQVARHTAALAATLGGLDRFVFTGGIGEHAPAVRRMVVERLKWLGAELDPVANAAGERLISIDRSRVLIEQRSTNEELAIVTHVAEVLS